MERLKKVAAIVAATVIVLAVIFCIKFFSLDKRSIGIVAGIISFVAHPLYIWAILKSGTKPHLLTWIPSSMLAGVALLVYSEAGGQETIYLVWGDFIGLTMIVVFSWIKKGNGEIFPEDIICFIGSLVSIAIFVAFHDAKLALWIALVAEVLALFPTARKTYRCPNEEDLLAWCFTLVGDFINIFAIGVFVETVYVWTLFVADGAVFALILWGWLKTTKRYQ